MHKPSSVLMRITAAALAFFGLALAVNLQVTAHHAFSAEFDPNRPVLLRGPIVRVEWVNPHTWIHLEVTNDDGSKTVWMVEGGTPNTLLRTGHLYRGGWLPEQGSQRPCQWPGCHLRRRPQVLHGLIGHWRAL